MIVTEEEAKTKICCGDEGCGQVVIVKVGLVEDNYERRCIGSACMAWRWLDGTIYNGHPREPEALGYCGKAGKP